MSTGKKTYLKKIKNCFSIPTKNEKAFLKKLIVDLSFYEQENPQANYDDYINKFGKPEELVSSYYTNYDNELNLIQKINFKRISYAFLVLALIATVSFVCVLLNINHNAEQHYISLKEVAITEN